MSRELDIVLAPKAAGFLEHRGKKRERPRTPAISWGPGARSLLPRSPSIGSASSAAVWPRRGSADSDPHMSGYGTVPLTVGSPRD
ncbi:hypothetical protein AGOR_G00149460 [Albula goreensis]|uniref:Uncharacterized protein n=1 Tax=Albula goreensis TaxID=1534307 RepID=A0A8T3D8Q3_9TELE|nr:hypothetical protein AGOR_G00149460 [Albula goreensis]